MNVVQLITDIASNSDIKIKSSAFKPIKTFTIQYRYADDISSPLIEFYEEPHEITFEFLHENGKSRSFTKTKIHTN